jgi:hypothetical protein
MNIYQKLYIFFLWLVSKARNGVNYELLGLISYGKSCGRSGFPGPGVAMLSLIL